MHDNGPAVYARHHNRGEKEEFPEVCNLNPAYLWELPDGGDLKLGFPALLPLLDHVANEEYSCIQVASVGPMGLAALLIARLLGIPVFTAYHSGLSDYLKTVTEDESLSDLAERYMTWFCNQCDWVQVDTKRALEALVKQGILRQKLRLCPWSVNSRLFSPRRRSEKVRSAYIPAASTSEFRGRSTVEQNCASRLDCSDPCSSSKYESVVLILYAERLTRGCGVTLLLNVFKKLVMEQLNLRLILHTLAIFPTSTDANAKRISIV